MGAPGLAVFQTWVLRPHPGLEHRETWGTLPKSQLVQVFKSYVAVAHSFD